MNFAFWRLFKDRDQQQKLYRMCVTIFKIIHQILLLQCKINAKYEKSYQPTASMDTGADGLPGVRVLLSNLTDYSYIQSDDQNLWYNNSGNFQCIKQCQVNLEDIFQHDFDQSSCHIQVWQFQM